MNLNPLKKDDNTDALVKALEDANNVDDGAATTQPAADPAAAPAGTDTSVTDSAVIAADPQITGGGVAPAEPVVSETPGADTPVANTDAPAPTDSTTGISFEGNDLPAGLSTDADAHLPTGVADTTPTADSDDSAEVVDPSIPAATSDANEGSGDNGELDGVKKDALEQLRPLIEKLDLEPADKFDKYLMMLRASDDPALIKPAFEAAQGISGEKEKAQALLDIINEINYITANQQSV